MHKDSVYKGVKLGLHPRSKYFVFQDSRILYRPDGTLSKKSAEWIVLPGELA